MVIVTSQEKHTRRVRSGSMRSGCRRSRSGSAHSASDSERSLSGGRRARSGSIRSGRGSRRSRKISRDDSVSSSRSVRSGFSRSKSGSRRACSGSMRSRSGSRRVRSGSMRSGYRRSRSGSAHSASDSVRSLSNARSGSMRSGSGSRRSRESSRSDSGRSRSGFRGSEGSCRSSRSSISSRSGSGNSHNGSRSSSQRSHSGSRSSRSHSGSRSNSGSHSRSGSAPISHTETISQINSSQSQSPSSARKSRKRNVESDSEDETSASNSKKYVKRTDSDDKQENDGEIEKPVRTRLFISDFDAMLLRKKEERKKRRGKLDIDIDNNNDELIDELMRKMKNAAAEDRQSNRERKPAMEKLSMLKLVTSQLIKKNFQSAFLEHDVLSVLAEWLAPLPNKSLPYHEIRENILRLLTIQFSKVDKSYLKHSGIGKAVMYLHKHPEETAENRKTAGYLIAGWARPIFGLSTDYRDMSKEERQKRDLARMPKRRKSPEHQRSTSAAAKRILNSAFNTTEERPLRPGDPGWVARARVPMPAMRDYIIRPKSKVQADISKPTKPQPDRYEVQMKKFLKTQRKNKSTRAVEVSLNGRNMPF